jgi:hypothetical protein
MDNGYTLFKENGSRLIEPAALLQSQVRVHEDVSRDRTILLLSMRGLADLVAYCLPYEFEDVIEQTTRTERINAQDKQLLEFERRVYKAARLATQSRTLASAFSPRLAGMEPKHDYKLFLAVFNHPHELFALAAIPNWRKHCDRAVCFISEMWVHLMPEYLLELLITFDHIFIGVRNPVEKLSRIIGRPCSYLPLAADVLRFAPYPEQPARVIDICNIGRRSPVTHGALMQLAAQRKIFYYYDTVAASGLGNKQRTFRVDNPAEHRVLLANVLRRSRYFIANRGRINEPQYARGHQEISARYYEGAAAGAVMLGEPPDSPDFESQFDWEDATILLPFDSPDVGRVIAGLDKDPQRLSLIRRRNVYNAALRHDWVYRLRVIFETVGLAPTEAMQIREQQLQAIASRAIAGNFDEARCTSPAL